MTAVQLREKALYAGSAKPSRTRAAPTGLISRWVSWIATLRYTWRVKPMATCILRGTKPCHSNAPRRYFFCMRLVSIIATRSPATFSYGSEATERLCSRSVTGEAPALRLISDLKHRKVVFFGLTFCLSYLLCAVAEISYMRVSLHI
jgi:hypothetical protein